MTRSSLAWIVVLAVLVPAIASAEVLHEQRSLYSQILVRQVGTTVCLSFSVRRSQRNQSCMDTRQPSKMLFAYTRMSMASLLFVPAPDRILVVGLGGGTLPTAFAELFPDAQVDAIEIDPAVVAVAERFFGFKASDRLRVHTRDARVWGKRALQRSERFDIIILDAFNGEYIPEHLLTREFLHEMQSLLAEQGVLVANTFAISDLYDHESATYAAVFDDFINFQTPESANRVVIAPTMNLDNHAIEQRAEVLAPRLKRYAVPIKRYAQMILEARDKAPDWREDARVLTDQYSPANLLQGRD